MIFYIFDKHNEHEIKESLHTFNVKTNFKQFLIFDLAERITENVLTQFPNQEIGFLKEQPMKDMENVIYNGIFNEHSPISMRKSAIAVCHDQSAEPNKTPSETKRLLHNLKNVNDHFDRQVQRNQIKCT